MEREYSWVRVTIKNRDRIAVLAKKNEISVHLQTGRLLNEMLDVLVPQEEDDENK